MAVVQTQSGNDLRALYSIFTKARRGRTSKSSELITELGEVAGIISEEVNIDNVVNEVFLGDD